MHKQRPWTIARICNLSLMLHGPISAARIDAFWRTAWSVLQVWGADGQCWRR